MLASSPGVAWSRSELALHVLVDFQDLLRSLGIPVVIYDRGEHDRDQDAVDVLCALALRGGG